MKTVKVLENAGEFAEDKDIAARIRREIVFPELQDGRRVILDFKGVGGATQSFVHGLIADPIRKLGAKVIPHIIFKGCNDSVKGNIGIVVDYGQADADWESADVRASAQKSK